VIRRDVIKIVGGSAAALGPPRHVFVQTAYKG